MNATQKTMLKTLTEISGISGMEGAVTAYIAAEVQDDAESVYEDAMGNLFAHIGNLSGKRIGIYAHMDEVGFIVRRIAPNGLIYFDIVGNIDERLLPGSEVNIIATDGRTIRGAIGNKSRHLQSTADMHTEVSYKNTGIDIGAFSKAEVQAAGIEVGCQIVFPTKCNFFENGTVLGKALDNRMSCYVLIQTIKMLKGKLNNVGVVGIFTAQEEIGARGARVAGYGRHIEQCITLDNVPIQNRDDIQPGEPELGGGPVIRIMDWLPVSKLGMFSNRSIVERLKSVASEKNIPHQPDVLTGTYLDSATAHLTEGGIPGGSICIPRRYSHSAVEMARTDDIDNTVQLLCEYILSVDADPLRFGKIYK